MVARSAGRKVLIWLAKPRAYWEIYKKKKNKRQVYARYLPIGKIYIGAKLFNDFNGLRTFTRLTPVSIFGHETIPENGMP